MKCECGHDMVLDHHLDVVMSIHGGTVGDYVCEKCRCKVDIRIVRIQQKEYVDIGNDTEEVIVPKEDVNPRKCAACLEGDHINCGSPLNEPCICCGRICTICGQTLATSVDLPGYYACINNQCSKYDKGLADILR